MLFRKIPKSYLKLKLFLNNWHVLSLLILGGITAWLSKDALTLIILSGKSFSELSLIHKFVIFSFYLLVFIFILLVFIFIIQLLFKINIFNKINFTINISPKQRILTFLLILSIGFAFIFFINNILTRIDTVNWTFINPNIIPTLDPVGIDFRLGLYRPSKIMLIDPNIYYFDNDHTSLTQYPPLLNLLCLPFQLFNENSAYLLQVFLLFFSNIMCLALVSFLVKDLIFAKTGLDNTLIWAITFSIFFGVLTYTLSSYPFLFSIERGNCDVIALLFSLLSIYVLIKKPNKIWIQVILLSIAVHLKIYPAALFAILLLKHGKKLILPSIIVNIVFLFALGPKNAYFFLQIIQHNSGAPYIWIGNHSGYSFAELISIQFPILLAKVSVLRNVFTLIPILLWIGSIYSLVKGKNKSSVILYLFMVTVPLMELVPSTSHDYKLVILNSAVIILFSMIVTNIIKSSKLFDYVQFIISLGILSLIGRSYVVNYSLPIIINNKYLFVVFLQIIFLINVIMFRQFENAYQPYPTFDISDKK